MSYRYSSTRFRTISRTNIHASWASQRSRMSTCAISIILETKTHYSHFLSLSLARALSLSLSRARARARTHARTLSPIHQYTAGNALVSFVGDLALLGAGCPCNACNQRYVYKKKNIYPQPCSYVSVSSLSIFLICRCAALYVSPCLIVLLLRVTYLRWRFS